MLKRIFLKKLTKKHFFILGAIMALMIIYLFYWVFYQYGFWVEQYEYTNFTKEQSDKILKEFSIRLAQQSEIIYVYRPRGGEYEVVIEGLFNSEDFADEWIIDDNIDIEKLKSEMDIENMINGDFLIQLGKYYINKEITNYYSYTNLYFEKLGASHYIITARKNECTDSEVKWILNDKKNTFLQKTRMIIDHYKFKQRK